MSNKTKTIADNLAENIAERAEAKEILPQVVDIHDEADRLLYESIFISVFGHGCMELQLSQHDRTINAVADKINKAYSKQVTETFIENTKPEQPARI